MAVTAVVVAVSVVGGLDRFPLPLPGGVDAWLWDPSSSSSSLLVTLAEFGNGKLFTGDCLSPDDVLCQETPGLHYLVATGTPLGLVYPTLLLPLQDLPHPGAHVLIVFLHWGPVAGGSSCSPNLFHWLFLAATSSH